VVLGGGQTHVYIRNDEDGVCQAKKKNTKASNLGEVCMDGLVDLASKPHVVDLTDIDLKNRRMSWRMRGTIMKLAK